jgi:hypothetical protein
VTAHPLPDAPAAAVPLRIAEYKARGGPAAADIGRAREFGRVLGEKGDALLFRGKRGEPAELFNRLADAVAVMAFCPGGVKVFGELFEVK